MMTEKGKLVSVMTLMGEIVGKVKAVNDHGLILERPRLLTSGPDGKSGFLPYVCLSGEPDADILIGSYVAIVPTGADAEKAYASAVSGIELV